MKWPHCLATSTELFIPVWPIIRSICNDEEGEAGKQEAAQNDPSSPLSL